MDAEDSDHGDFGEWEEDEDEDTEVQSLFCSTKLPNVTALIEHDLQNFGFNLAKCCSSVGDDDISLIMLVNFIRSEVQATKPEELTSSYIAGLEKRICEDPRAFLQDEKYMLPVLRDVPDPLLYLLQEALHLNEGEGSDNDDNIEAGANAGLRGGAVPVGAAGAGAGAAQQELELVQHMQADIARLQSMVNALVAESDSAGPQHTNATVSQTSGKGESDVPNDSYYFDSYGQLGIHETMLRDRPRTSTYGAAMLQNAEFFKGKTVLDVGCGTGILCMFAAKAGAKKVVGIDLSSIIERSKKVVQKNGFADVITLVKGRLETTELPLELGEVDVIVSEWMGYGLYYENMLTSVLHARDKYLNKSGGVLMPSEASIYVDAMTAPGDEDRIGYWSDVYGFDMEEMRSMLVPEAQVQYVRPEDIVSTRCRAHVLDIGTAVDADLDFSAPFSVTIDRDETELKAFVLSFDVLFAKGNLSIPTAASTTDTETNTNTNTTFQEQVLSTGPKAAPTHWKQTVLWLSPEHRVQVTKGTVLQGSVCYLRADDNKRDYDIVLQWRHPKTAVELVQRFVLAS